MGRTFTRWREPPSSSGSKLERRGDSGIPPFSLKVLAGQETYYGAKPSAPREAHRRKNIVLKAGGGRGCPGCGHDNLSDACKHGKAARGCRCRPRAPRLIYSSDFTLHPFLLAFRDRQRAMEKMFLVFAHRTPFQASVQCWGEAPIGPPPKSPVGRLN
jgi:hypothetical protein